MIKCIRVPELHYLECHNEIYSPADVVTYLICGGRVGRVVGEGGVAGPEVAEGVGGGVLDTLTVSVTPLGGYGRHQAREA